MDDAYEEMADLSVLLSSDGMESERKENITTVSTESKLVSKTEEEITFSSHNSKDETTDDLTTLSQQSILRRKRERERLGLGSTIDCVPSTQNTVCCSRKKSQQDAFYFARDSDMCQTPKGKPVIYTPNKTMQKLKGIFTSSKKKPAPCDWAEEGDYEPKKPDGPNEPPYLNVIPEEIVLEGPFGSNFKFDITLENPTDWPVYFRIDYSDMPFRIKLTQLTGLLFEKETITICAVVYPTHMYHVEDIESTDFFFQIHEEIKEKGFAKNMIPLRLKVLYNGTKVFESIVDDSKALKLKYKKMVSMNRLLSCLTLVLLLLTFCLVSFYVL